MLTTDQRHLSVMCVCACVHVCWVVSDSLQPHGLWPSRLLRPWDSPGRNTAVGCHFLLQGIFRIQSQTCISCIGRGVLYPSTTWEAVLPHIHFSSDWNACLWLKRGSYPVSGSWCPLFEVALRHFLLSFVFNVRCYKHRGRVAHLESLMRNCCLCSLCLILLCFQALFCTGVVYMFGELIWHWESQMASSGGHVFSVGGWWGLCWGRLCLPCLIRVARHRAGVPGGQACWVMLAPSSTPTGVLKLCVLEQVAGFPPITLPTTIYLVFLSLLLLDRQSKALKPSISRDSLFL